MRAKDVPAPQRLGVALALRELAPDTDSVTRTYSARISVKQPDASLRLGMTASVFAADVEGARAIRLPLTAISTDASVYAPEIKGG